MPDLNINTLHTITQGAHFGEPLPCLDSRDMDSLLWTGRQENEDGTITYWKSPHQGDAGEYISYTTNKEGKLLHQCATRTIWDDNYKPEIDEAWFDTDGNGTIDKYTFRTYASTDDLRSYTNTTMYSDGSKDVETVEYGGREGKKTKVVFYDAEGNVKSSKLTQEQDDFKQIIEDRNGDGKPDKITFRTNDLYSGNIPYTQIQEDTDLDGIFDKFTVKNNDEIEDE